MHQVKPHTCNAGVLLIQGFLWELERWQCGDVQTPAARHRSVRPDTAAPLEPQRQDRPETGGLRLPIQYVFNTDIPLDSAHLMKIVQYYSYRFQIFYIMKCLFI